MTASFRQHMVRYVREGTPATVTVLAFVAAIVLGGLLIAFSDPHVLGNFSIGAAWHSAAGAYSAMFKGAVVDPSTVSGGSATTVFRPITETLVNATPLVLSGLAVMLPFRAGLFNIGAAGQFTGGAIVAGWLGFAFSMPPVVHVVVATAGGFVGGAVVGWAVGELRARTGANEVIVTIMLNYVMAELLLYLLGTSTFRRPHRTDPISPLVAGTARLPHLAGSGLRLNTGLLVALAAAVAVWWLLARSVPGFRFRAIGANPDAARAAGIDVERGYATVMLLAGGLAGLAGAAIVLGVNFDLDPQVAGTYGVDAITIALLGRGTSLGVVLASLLYGALRAGGVTMQASTSTPIDIVTVIQSVIVLFVAAPPLVRALFRLRRPSATDGTVPLLAPAAAGGEA